MLALLIFSVTSRAQQTSPCASPKNEIVAENCKPGSPRSEWDLQGAGSESIQGFATDISVGQGDTVRFKVKTDATDYRLDIYRLGYYGGDGARKVDTIQPSASLPQDQPKCQLEPPTGLIDCGNWGISASWDVPADAVSGVYIAKLVREDGTDGASHVIFVVRDDDGDSDLLFQTSDTTWQAYNRYGGNSLYAAQSGEMPVPRAYKVSYNRPFSADDSSPLYWLFFTDEYPMLKWLEMNGYDVSYFTGVDSDRRGAEIKEHKVFLSVGHDEYWSGGQRENVEAARDAGVNLAFFSGDEVLWKTRWEGSVDGSNTPYRTLVCYKESYAGAKIDPSPEWTGAWRDPRPINPEGPQPENALTGTMVTVACCTYAIEVPAEYGRMRFWRNTEIADLPAGGKATLPWGTLGYEWDEDLDNGYRPAGLVRMSSTVVDVPQRIQDDFSVAPGTATHSLTLYRDENGSGPDALVFGAGTIQWSWGLDYAVEPPDPRMQQAMVNLFADMGVQPATLQGNLTPATASTDTSAPTSRVGSPTSGSAVEVGKPVTIRGTATDTGGGVVGGVEVSVDDGRTWHRAEGWESWHYSWTPEARGPVTIKSRAADDSANLESPSAGVNVTVGPPAPSKPKLADASDSGRKGDDLTNDATPTFVGTAEPNSAIELFADGASLGTTDADSSGNWGFTVPDGRALADGSHQITAEAKDEAGNASPASEALSVTVDTAAPNGTVAINGGDAYTNSTTVNLTLNVDDPSPGSGVAEMRFSEDGTTWSEWEQFTTSKMWTVSGGDGEKIVYVQFRDAAGNESATAQDTIGLDTVNPTTTRTLSPAPNANGWNNSDVSVTLNATDNPGGSGVKEISYSVNGSEPITVQQSSAQIPVTDEGETTISYHATDSAGNTEAQQTFTVKIDESAPDATITSGPSGPTNDSTPTFSFGGSDNLTASSNLLFSYKVVANGVAPESVAWSEYSSSTSTTLGDTTGLSEDSYTFYVKTKDQAGNEAGSPAQRSFTVDTTAPTLRSVTPANNSTGVAPGTNVTATFFEQMNRTTITEMIFKLYRVNPDGTTTQVANVTVKLSVDGLEATLNPFGRSSTVLERNTRYRAVITTGAQDLAGNPLAARKVWSFTTR